MNRCFKRTNALIDSGSVRTLMNGELYESLNLTTPTRSDLVTLTGTRVPTAGVVDPCLDECFSG